MCVWGGGGGVCFISSCAMSNELLRSCQHFPPTHRYSTIYTMFPVFSLALDEDVSADIALMYPELYQELMKGRSLTLKTFFIWVLISIYQGQSRQLFISLLSRNYFNHKDNLGVVQMLKCVSMYRYMNVLCTYMSCNLLGIAVTVQCTYECDDHYP